MTEWIKSLVYCWYNRFSRASGVFTARLRPRACEFTVYLFLRQSLAFLVTTKSYSVVQTYPASLLHIAVSAAAARVSVAVSVCMCGANPCDCLQPCLYMFPIPWLQGTTIIVQDTYLMSLQIHAGLKFVSSHSYICNEVVFYIHQTKHTLPIHSLFWHCWNKSRVQITQKITKKKQVRARLGLLL